MRGLAESQEPPAAVSPDVAGMCVGLLTGMAQISPVAAGAGACTTAAGGAATSVGPPTMVQAAS